jgi:hypothetical protein
MYYWDALEQKQNAERLVESLPTATLYSLDSLELENPSGWKAVEVEGAIVGTVTNKYQLVQHSEAFMPILNGLDATGESYRISVWNHKGRAGMRIITSAEATDGVTLGFQAINSVDGTTALFYNLVSKFKEKAHLELVGYRQTCSNGMVVRVPLAESEFMRLEVVQRVHELVRKSMRFVHVGDVKSKAESVQYLVEAIALLKEPVKLMIEKAKFTQVSKEEAEKLLAKYIGMRLFNKCVREYKFGRHEKEGNLWSLYNAITWVASHGDVSKTSAKSLLDGSADLLKDVLVDGVQATLPQED